MYEKNIGQILKLDHIQILNVVVEYNLNQLEKYSCTYIIIYVMKNSYWVGKYVLLD